MKCSIHFRMVFLYFILSFPPCLFAQEPQLSQTQQTPEEILLSEIPVVAVSKKVQKESEAPASVTVITSDDIKNSGARTIAEAVQYIVGINLFGVQGFNIRGIGAGGRILFLVDGRRCNDVFSGSFEDGFERPLTNIERIEVIKGPASSLYGTNAFSGIINIITKKGIDNKGLEVRAKGGNFTTQRYEVLFGGSANNIDTFFSLSAHADKGNDQAGSFNQFRAYEIFGKIKWQDITLSGGYRPNRSFTPRIPGVFPTALILKRFDSFAHLQYEKTINKKLTTFTQFYMQHEVISLPSTTGNLDVRDLRFEGEFRANYKFNDLDNITFGFEVRRDRTNNVKGVITEQYRSTNKGFYVENELRPIKELIITTGLRVDDNTIFETSVNPRLGAVLILPTKTIIKAFYGRAFRGPEFVNLFTDTPIGPFLLLKNPSLQPEKINSFDLEVSQRLTKQLEARVNIYRNSLSNLINAVFDPKTITLTFANVGKASVDGIELSLKAKLSKSLTGFVNESIQFAKDEVTNTRFELVPRHTVNIGFTYHTNSIFTFSAFGKYASPRPRTGSLPLKSYFKANFVCLAKITPRVEFSAALYNLSNFKNGQTLVSPETRVQAVIGLNLKLW